jgi:hypothetical protein
VVSAVELLKKVSQLPEREREKFLFAVLQMDEKTPQKPEGKSKRVKWPDVEARARRTSGHRILPNLVLLEREEAAF